MTLIPGIPDAHDDEYLTLIPGIPDAHDDEYLTLMDQTFTAMGWASTHALDFHEYCEWINLVLQEMQDPGDEERVFPVLT